MRELSIHELSFVSGAGMAIRPLFQLGTQTVKNVAKNPVAQGSATATYVASNVAAGNEMSMVGGTGAVVAGMFGGNFGATLASAATGGLVERGVNGVNTVLKDDQSGNNYGDGSDKSGNNYGY